MNLFKIGSPSREAYELGGNFTSILYTNNARQTQKQTLHIHFKSVAYTQKKKKIKEKKKKEGIYIYIYVDICLHRERKVELFNKRTN